MFLGKLPRIAITTRRLQGDTGGTMVHNEHLDGHTAEQVEGAVRDAICAEGPVHLIWNRFAQLSPAD